MVDACLIDLGITDAISSVTNLDYNDINHP